jgi:hypothetical protein
VKLDEVLLFGLEGFEAALVDFGLLRSGFDAGRDELADHLWQPVLLLWRVEDRGVVSRVLTTSRSEHRM